MTIYAHAREHHQPNRSETENKAEPETTTSGAETQKKIAPAETATTSTVESAESSTPSCDTFGEESSKAATGGTSEHTSCSAVPPTDASLGKAYLRVGESLFGLVIVTPFLLHFLKRKI